jgi:hypothetical protein
MATAIPRIRMAMGIQRILMVTAIRHTVGVGDGRGDIGLIGDRTGIGLHGHIGTGALDLASIGQSMLQLMVPDFTAGDSFREVRR